MQDDSTHKHCTMCQRSIAADTASSNTWVLKKIADYKKRGFTASGFPYNGTVYVEGWKLQDFRTLETVVCPDCVNKRLGELKAAIAEDTRKVKLIAIISGAIGLILTALSVAYALVDPAFDWTESPYDFLVVPAALALGFSAIAFLIYKNPNSPADPAQTLHRELLEKGLTSSTGGDPEAVNLVRLDQLDSSSGKGAIVIDQQQRPASCLSSGSWDIVTATWVTNSPAPGPPNSYPQNYLQESLNNLEFKSAGEFLEAGEHGDVV